jgi:hypothetical protein
MNSDDARFGATPVVTLDHDGDFIAKPFHLNPNGNQAQFAGEAQADMLVLGMAVEFSGRGLEDVSCRRASCRHASVAIFIEFGEPLDLGSAVLNNQGFKPLGPDELDRPGTILAKVGEQSNRIAR